MKTPGKKSTERTDLLGTNESRGQELHNAILAFVEGQITQQPLSQSAQETINSLSTAERATIMQALGEEILPAAERSGSPTLTMADAIGQINARRTHEYVEGLLPGLEREIPAVQQNLRRQIVNLLEPRNTNYLSPEHLGYDLIDLVIFHNLSSKISNRITLQGQYEVATVLEIKDGMIELKEDLSLDETRRGELRKVLKGFGIPFGRPLTAIEIENFGTSPVLLKTDEEKWEEREIKAFPKTLQAKIVTLRIPIKISNNLRKAEKEGRGPYTYIGDVIEIDPSSDTVQLVEAIRLQRLDGIGPGSVESLESHLKPRGIPLGEKPTPQQRKVLEAFKAKRGK